MYGYHPLSLSLLVGLINEDHEHRGDIEAVKNLEIFEDVKARRHHVLERAYESLAPERRDLLSKISCFRGSMEYAVLKKVFPSPDLDKALLDLRKRGLLQQISPLLVGEGSGVRYDMHPIVRHYAYDKFAAPDKTDAHTRLINYFEAVPAPQTVTTLEDLAPVIELYHHMVRARNLDEAFDLFYDRINEPAYYQFGAHQLYIELLRALFLEGEDKPPRLKKEGDQAWALNGLANSYSQTGQPRRAVPVFQNAGLLAEKMDNQQNVASGLCNMATQQLIIGALSAAERNLRRQIDLCREFVDEFVEAAGYQELGCILSYRGAWQEAEQELDTGLKLFEKNSEVQSQSVIWSYCALRFLLMAREAVGSNQSSIVNLKSSIECAQRALELANEQAKNIPVPRDYVRAYWLLGAAYRANNELTLAEENLSKALNLCRQINAVDHEANILLDLARLRYAQGDFKDAQEKASEALVITERSGYVLQGADVNLFLATLALEGYRLEGLKVGSDKDAAIHHAKEALRLATCDGGEYKYKVAYDEAERMLASLNV
jgi:tetratricopeptide (TPR) repeat protein